MTKFLLAGDSERYEMLKMTPSIVGGILIIISSFILIYYLGPSLMPGGTREAYQYIDEIVQKVAAQTDDGACVTYIGPGIIINILYKYHNLILL